VPKKGRDWDLMKLELQRGAKRNAPVVAVKKEAKRDAGLGRSGREEQKSNDWL